MIFKPFGYCLQSIGQHVTCAATCMNLLWLWKACLKTRDSFIHSYLSVSHFNGSISGALVYVREILCACFSFCITNCSSSRPTVRKIIKCSFSSFSVSEFLLSLGFIYKTHTHSLSRGVVSCKCLVSWSIVKWVTVELNIWFC